jgi:polyisoprenoid-binding protein YceI
MVVRNGILGICALTAATALAGLPARAGSGRTAAEWSVDPVHSSVIFRAKHFNTAYFYGRFDDLHGTVNFDEASPGSSSLDLELKVDSVNTGSGKRNDHLKSPDFFNAAKFPTCTFKSKSFAKAGENTFDVAGDLTVHGVTKPITVKLEKTGQGSTQMGERIGFETVFTLKRSDFGITFMPDGIGDEIRLIISLEAQKK